MKRSGGKVECEYYFGGSLAQHTELFDAVRTKMADAAPLYACFHVAQFPIFQVHRMPAAPTESTEAAWWAFLQLGYSDWGKAELAKNNLYPVGVTGHSGDYIYSVKQVKGVADLKNMRVATSGPYGDAFKTWGCEPMEMASPEIYEAMKRGLVDACNKPLFQGITLGMHEVAPYISFPKIGFTVLIHVINLDTWNSLPPDIQNLIDEIAAEMPKVGAEMYKADDEMWLSKMKEEGMTFTTWSDAEAAKAREMVLPLWDKWAEDMTANGLPGTEIKNQYLDWIKTGP